MKFSLAIASIMTAVASATSPFAPAKSTNTAKNAYMNNLMSGGAKVVRALDQNEDFEVDITGNSLKFQKCQFVKSHDDELAEEEESYTGVLATKRFVVFRLCPSDSTSSCNTNYGEYIVDLETYLETTVKYQQELQEEMCNACQNCQDDGGRRRKLVDVDCDTCYDECTKIENMEENRYVDATTFLQCQCVYDPEDDSLGALYAGPMCASQGAKIKIGVFLDENCYTQDTSKDVEDYLINDDGYPIKLAHDLLKTVYNKDTLVSCLAVGDEEDENGDGDDNNGNGEEEEAEVLEMCQILYEASAKCEEANGFDTGFANQASEEVVCDFIDSLVAGSYDETGEIAVNGGNSSTGGSSKTTRGQKFALFFLFVAGTIGLSVYAAMLLHKKLTGSSGSNVSGNMQDGRTKHASNLVLKGTAPPFSSCPTEETYNLIESSRK